MNTHELCSFSIYLDWNIATSSSTQSFSLPYVWMFLVQKDLCALCQKLNSVRFSFIVRIMLNIEMFWQRGHVENSYFKVKRKRIHFIIKWQLSIISNMGEIKWNFLHTEIMNRDLLGRGKNFPFSIALLFTHILLFLII